MNYWEESQETLNERLAEIRAKFSLEIDIIDKMKKAYLEDIELFNLIKGNEKAVDIFVKLRELEKEFDKKTLRRDYQLRRLAKWAREDAVRRNIEWGESAYDRIIKEYIEIEDVLEGMLNE